MNGPSVFIHSMSPSMTHHFAEHAAQRAYRPFSYWPRYRQEAHEKLSVPQTKPLLVHTAPRGSLKGGHTA
jgi:hypothetical protein